MSTGVSKSISYIFTKRGLLFLLFSGVMLLNISSGMITLLGLFSIALFLFIPVKRYIDSYALWLLFFSIVYVCFSYINGAYQDVSSILAKGLPWFVFYIFGKYVIDEYENERSILNFILYSILMMSLISQLSIVYKISSSGILVDPTRSFYYLGRDSELINCTTALSQISSSLVGLSAIFIVKDYKFQRILFVLICLLTLLCSVNTLTRGPIVVCAFTFVIMAFVYYRKHITKLIFLFTAVSILLYLLLNSTGFSEDIISGFAERNEANSVLNMGSRTFRWASGIHDLFIYPFGWWTKGNSDYLMHNMWLDIAKMSGIVPFTILLVISIKMFFNNLFLIRLNKTIIPYLLLALNLCICASNFQEPVSGGLIVGFLCMVWGMTNALYKKTVI